MFTKFASMLGEGDSLTIIITKKGDKLITSIIPRKSGLNDGARERLSPLVISGTPEELEEGFMEAVSSPIIKVTGILTNMRDFEKSAEEVEVNSKAKKSKQNKEKKESEDKKKKFDLLSKKADGFEKDKKYLNAIACLKQAKEFSANKSAVEGRIQKIEKLSGQNVLFGEMDTEEPVKENYLEDIPEQEEEAQESTKEEEEEE